MRESTPNVRVAKYFLICYAEDSPIKIVQHNRKDVPYEKMAPGFVDSFTAPHRMCM